MRNDLQLHHDTVHHRYEARAGGVSLGYAEYRIEGADMVVTHTIVPPGNGGQGVGSFLARGVLDAARTAALHVVPECSFIAAYLRRHPGDLGLVRPETRRAFDLQD